MKLQKVLAGVMVAVLALTAAPVGNVKAADGIPIDEAHFPDENFRAYVSKNCDTDGNGTLSNDEIMDTKEIRIPLREISSLKGIEYFTEMTYLECHNNQLTTLDVSKCTALELLECDINQLTTLDVSKNTALRGLGCSGNQLTTLDVSENTALEYLWCENNQLTTLDVSKNTALETLHCNQNQLTTLDVSENTALTELYCDDNQLTTLDVSECTELNLLLCNNNYFNEVDISNNLKLEEQNTDGTIDRERKVLIVNSISDLLEITPDKTISIGDKVTFKTKKKVARVVVSNEAAVSVKKKGKKVIVTGKSAGKAIVTALNKKDKELGSWVVEVE